MSEQSASLRQLSLRLLATSDYTRLSWDPNLSAERVRSALMMQEAGHLKFFVLELLGEAVGMVSVDLLRGMVWHLSVKAEQRRRRLGQRLMDLAERELERAGWSEVTLMVEVTNYGARKLYETRGYQACLENGRDVVRVLYWEERGVNGEHTCVKMRKRLVR